MSAAPHTPTRKSACNQPRTPTRQRIDRTPLSAESDNIVTPMTPSPSRAYRSDNEMDMNIKYSFARRLFFTPQHGSQSYIPPSPPLTPQAFRASKAAATPLELRERHLYARPIASGDVSPDVFELGSPATFRRHRKNSPNPTSTC